MKPWWNSFKIAFSMYSKVPMPKSDWTKENMRYIMCLFPLIGVIIGAVTWAWGHWGLQITRSHLFYSVVLVLIPVVITGGIHLDGLLEGAEAGDPEGFSCRGLCHYHCSGIFYILSRGLQRDDPESTAGGLYRFCAFQSYGRLFYCRFSHG